MDKSRDKPRAPSFIFIDRSGTDDPLDGFTPEQTHFDWHADPAVMDFKRPPKQPTGIDADRAIRILFTIAVVGAVAIGLVLAVAGAVTRPRPVASVAVATPASAPPPPSRPSSYAVVEQRSEPVETEPQPVETEQPRTPETRPEDTAQPAPSNRPAPPVRKFQPPVRKEPPPVRQEQLAREKPRQENRQETPVIAVTISADEPSIARVPPVTPAPVTAVSLSSAPVNSPAPVAVATTGAVEAPASPAANPNQDQTAIRSVVGQYRNAFSKLDAAAAAAVWPTVDRKALDRAFSQLSEQAFAFDSCDVSVNGVLGIASCSGRVRFVPKVGNRTPQLASREWSFTLRKSSDDWVIHTVQSR